MLCARADSAPVSGVMCSCSDSQRPPNEGQEQTNNTSKIGSGAFACSAACQLSSECRRRTLKSWLLFPWSRTSPSSVVHPAVARRNGRGLVSGVAATAPAVSGAAALLNGAAGETAGVGSHKASDGSSETTATSGSPASGASSDASPPLKVVVPHAVQQQEGAARTPAAGGTSKARRHGAHLAHPRTGAACLQPQSGTAHCAATWRPAGRLGGQAQQRRRA